MIPEYPRHNLRNRDPRQEEEGRGGVDEFHAVQRVQEGEGGDNHVGRDAGDAHPQPDQVASSHQKQVNCQPYEGNRFCYICICIVSQLSLHYLELS